MTTMPRRRRLPGILLGMAMLVIALPALAGCGPAEGLRVETTVPNPTDVPTAEATGSAPRDQPFSADEIRWAILDTDDAQLPTDEGSVEEVLLYCPECLTLGDSMTAADKTFQLAMVRTPTTELNFAAFAISASDGEPTVELAISGNDISLSPGRGGTVVAQESVFQAGDEVCCPSGWAVRVYRYHDGHFEQGQRISKVNE